MLQWQGVVVVCCNGTELWRYAAMARNCGDMLQWHGAATTCCDACLRRVTGQRMLAFV